MMKSTAKAYGTVAVFLHWASALLVLVLLGTGFRAAFTIDEAAKIAALRVHLPVAVGVFALTAGRLIWWARFDTRPAPVEGAVAWQENVARWTHRGLYLLLVLLLVSGVGMSVLSGLPDALFGVSDFPDLSALPPRAAHGIAAVALVGLVLLHAGAAVKHHVFDCDPTLRRMWFGATRRP